MERFILITYSMDTMRIKIDIFCPSPPPPPQNAVLINKYYIFATLLPVQSVSFKH